MSSVISRVGRRVNVQMNRVVVQDTDRIGVGSNEVYVGPNCVRVGEYMYGCRSDHRSV